MSYVRRKEVKVIYVFPGDVPCSPNAIGIKGAVSLEETPP
jgi:hypothetical protein